MVLFNYSTRELTAKIVYYGPGICGKTTNLQFIHENLPGAVRGKMLSLATKTDRTLFFDFLPIDLGEIRGMKTRVQLYTVPGQVFYNETRKLVLKGVDGIVFVADSQETMLGANVESFKNLEENLRGHGMKLADIPHVIQFNKRDLPKLSAIEDMNAALNKYNAPFYESVAPTGIGVQDTLKAIVKLVLLNLTRKYEPKSAGETAAVAAPQAAVAQPTAQPVAVAAMASATSVPAASARTGGGVAEMPMGSVTTQSAPRSSIPLSPTEPPRKAPPQAKDAMSAFRQDEIDGLVDEVEEIGTSPAAAPVDEGAWMGVRPGEDESTVEDVSVFGSTVPIEEVLSKTAPQPAASPARAEKAAPTVHRPEAPPQKPAAAPVESDILLTEVASDEDLFTDPSLEIAQMAPGQTREILVPVMLGEGAMARRFKLAIRLRLDPVE
jgi:signal recognition particle receptor subunit beta